MLLILNGIVSLFHCIPIVQICSFYITALFFTSYITFYTIIDTALFHYFIAYSLYKSILHVSLFHCFSVFQLYKSHPKPSLYCSTRSTWYSTRHCFRQRRLSDVTEKVAGVSMWGRRRNPSSSTSSISTTKWWRTFFMWEGQGWKYSSSMSSSSS